jgi:hypothetical protein
MRQALLNNFAIRSFRDTGDRDYIHARLAYRAQLVPQFLWSSLHCLEKYVKCILLLNRVPAKSLGHSVLRGVDMMSKNGPFPIPLTDQTENFIKRLEKGAEFRYFEVSYSNHYFDIIRLDAAVWELRRYCQPLNYVFEMQGKKVNALEMNLKRVRRGIEKEEKGTCIMGGWLESVLAEENHAAREPFLWKNLYFGASRRKAVKLRGFLEAGNAPLYMHPEILDDVLEYIYLPKRVEKAWREEFSRRVKEKDIRKENP